MATRTIDILLNLESKPQATKDLVKRFKDLEKYADQTRKAMDKVTDPKKAKLLAVSLDNIQREMRDINSEAKKRTLEKNLKASADQANKLRERMEKAAQVGARLAVVGAAIVAPFALAVRKYVETVGEGEETSQRIIALQKRWEDSQVRIGRVTAEILLPTLEKALDVIDKIVKFSEENPGFVKAAVGIGASLVVLGGIVTTTAQIVSTIATVQGLLASVGVGGTAAGTAGVAGAGMSAAVAAGVTTALSALGIAIAVVAAAEATRRLLNWALGTDTTWADIWTTLQQLVFISAEGWKLIPSAISEIVTGIVRNMSEIAQKSTALIVSGIKNYFINLGNAVKSGLQSLASGIQNAFARLASALGFRSGSAGAQVGGSIPRRANGGYLANKGVFMGGEKGREFVLSNSTTRAAESVIGGGLTQARLLQALSGGRSVSYHDYRRFDSSVSASDRRLIRDDTMLAIAGAL